MSATIEVRALHDAQKLGRNRHTRKHAHVATTGIARGKTADGGPDGAENDASSLPHRCHASIAASRNFEHEPVRQNMPSNVRLAEDVGAFEMEEGLVEAASHHQLSSQPDFLFEQFLVRCVHATRGVQLGCHLGNCSDQGSGSQTKRQIQRSPDTWLRTTVRNCALGEWGCRRPRFPQRERARGMGQGWSFRY